MDIKTSSYNDLLKYAREIGLKAKGRPKREDIEIFVSSKLANKKTVIRMPKYTVSIPGKPKKIVY